MVTITCDNCGAKRPERLPANTEWILGYDLETETPKSVQRSIRLLDHWDDRRSWNWRDRSLLDSMPGPVSEAIGGSHERGGIADNTTLVTISHAHLRCRECGRLYVNSM